MKIIIKATNFEGYQITKVTDISKEELDEIKPLIEAIKTFGKRAIKNLVL